MFTSTQEARVAQSFETKDSKIISQIVFLKISEHSPHKSQIALQK